MTVKLLMHYWIISDASSQHYFSIIYM